MNIKNKGESIVTCMVLIYGDRRVYEHEQIKRKEVMKIFGNLLYLILLFYNFQSTSIIFTVVYLSSYFTLTKTFQWEIKLAWNKYQNIVQ